MYSCTQHIVSSRKDKKYNMANIVLDSFLMP
jgi:hypothetical protein